MKKSLLLLSLIVSASILGSQNAPVDKDKPAKARNLGKQGTKKQTPAKPIVDCKSGEETAQFLEENGGRPPHLPAHQPSDCKDLREARRHAAGKTEARKINVRKAAKQDLTKSTVGSQQ
jgi:hypothetical protein